MAIRKGSWTLHSHLCAGFFLRLALIMYGAHHDKTRALKFTDVDYHVLTDGASEMCLGRSPFNRHTYRYSPLLALILLPNVSFHFLFGKLVFSFCDLLIARLIHAILDPWPPRTRLWGALMWLYNPLVIGISARGSSDSIPSLLVLLLVYLVKRRLPTLSGLVLGLAIHVKLYPIIYSLPIYLSMTPLREQQYLISRLLPSTPKLRLVMGTLVGFLWPTLFSFLLYGDQYLEESLLHHLRRVDTRHNFSVYFYALYLCADAPLSPLATLAPQAMVVGALAVRYGTTGDLHFALFAQTVAFVTFNKVVTSQYFVWFLVLLPLVFPRLRMSNLKALLLFTLWVAAQASWLLPAYLLEFEGVNTFTPIWLESVAFFSCNVGILMALIAAYKPALPHVHSTRKFR